MVTIKPFTTDAANLGTGVSGTKEQQQAAQTLRTEAPKELEAAFMKALTAGGLFKGVVRDGTGDIVVEGSFTDMNPGSPLNKSDVLGERSVMAVSGTVRDGSGKLLARFEQRRVAATRYSAPTRWKDAPGRPESWRGHREVPESLDER